MASTTTCLPPGRRTSRSGRSAPVFGRAALLLAEVAPCEHAGHLDDAAQLHLAPAAAHVRGAQRAHEARRLALQLLTRLRHQIEVRLDRVVLPAPLLLHITQLRIDLAERLGDRLHQRVDRLLAPRQLGGTQLALLAEPLLRQRQERLVVLPQRVGRQRLERIAEGRFARTAAALHRTRQQRADREAERDQRERRARQEGGERDGIGRRSEPVRQVREHAPAYGLTVSSTRSPLLALSRKDSESVVKSRCVAPGGTTTSTLSITRKSSAMLVVCPKK